MAEENQGEQLEETQVDAQQVENPVDETESDAAPAAQQDDWKSEQAALKAQLARYEERSRYLEQTNRLLEQDRLSRQAPQPSQDQLSAELAALDTTLDPILKRRLQSSMDPIQQHVANLTEQLDANRFETYLTRVNPDVLDNEDELARIQQNVEMIRQNAAQQYGKYLSRTDAYRYWQGWERERESVKGRKGRKTAQVQDEAKRQLQRQATQTGVESNAGGRQPTGSAAVEAALKKLRSGQRLSEKEHEMVENHLSNVHI